MKQHERRYSRDLKRLLNLELERNNRVRAVLNAYEELAEGEKALFRLAAEISQDRADATIEPKQRSSNEVPAPPGPWRRKVTMPATVGLHLMLPGDLCLCWYKRAMLSH